MKEEIKSKKIINKDLIDISSGLDNIFEIAADATLEQRHLDQIQNHTIELDSNSELLLIDHSGENKLTVDNFWLRVAQTKNINAITDLTPINYFIRSLVETLVKSTGYELKSIRSHLNGLVRQLAKSENYNSVTKYLGEIFDLIEKTDNIKSYNRNTEVWKKVIILLGSTDLLDEVAKHELFTIPKIIADEKISHLINYLQRHESLIEEGFNYHNNVLKCNIPTINFIDQLCKEYNKLTPYNPSIEPRDFIKLLNISNYSKIDPNISLPGFVQATIDSIKENKSTLPNQKTKNNIMQALLSIEQLGLLKHEKVKK